MLVELSVHSVKMLNPSSLDFDGKFLSCGDMKKNVVGVG